MKLIMIVKQPHTSTEYKKSMKFREKNKAIFKQLFILLSYISFTSELMAHMLFFKIVARHGTSI